MAAEHRAARIIRTVIDLIEPQFSVELWDGTRIGDSADGPVLVINDPMTVRQLALKPNIGSIVELWVSGQIDVKNGTLFDLVERGPKGKLKQKLKSTAQVAAAERCSSRCCLSRGKSQRSSGLGGKDPYVSGSNKEAITHHYDVSNAFYQLFLDDRMVYTCAYFTDWANTIDQAQADKLELICRKLRLQPGRAACWTLVAAGAPC